MKLEALQKDHYYHIFNRGINSTNIFASARNKEYFLKLYQKHVSQNVSTFAYCLLANHFHLAVRIDSEPKKAIQSISNLFNAYAKAFNKEQGRTGSLFEKHFRRIEISTEKYLQQLILYIHLNPHTHFGTDFRNFSFSSYSVLISEEPTFLSRTEVLTLFGGRQSFIHAHQKKTSDVQEIFKPE